MCVRAACYIPEETAIQRIRAHGRRMIRRRNCSAVVEIAAIGAFLATVLIWSSVFSGT